MELEVRETLPCVAGGIVGASEINFWRRARNNVLAAEFRDWTTEPPEATGEAAINTHSPRGFAARFSAPPPKLYFACAHNIASYAG